VPRFGKGERPGEQIVRCSVPMCDGGTAVIDVYLLSDAGCN